MLTTSCDADMDACCVDLGDIAAHILDRVYAAVAACYDDECLKPAPYLTMGNGDDGVGDALTVSFSAAELSPDSVRNGAALRLPMVVARFVVRLHESGWPTATTAGDVVRPPDPADQNRAAQQAYAHGEKMYRTLLGMNARREMLPASVKGCGPASVGPLTPVPPRGGVVGWTVTVQIPVAWGGG